MLLDVEQATVRFGGVTALNEVSVHSNPGESVCIIGPNASGKTTLLRSILGLVRLSAGQITFNDKRIERMAAHEIARLGIGIVPQGRRIFPHLTVEENLRVGAYTRSSDQLKDRLELVYSYFPLLAERKRVHGSVLSGGQQQMLAIGRALMLDPLMLALDEPSIGLAPKAVQEIFGILNRVCAEEGVTLLLVEQNASLAFRLCSRGYVLSQGNLVLSGPVEELRRDETIAEIYLGKTTSNFEREAI